MKTINIVLTTRVSNKIAKLLEKRGIDITELETIIENKFNPKEKIKVTRVYFE